MIVWTDQLDDSLYKDSLEREYVEDVIATAAGALIHQFALQDRQPMDFVDAEEASRIPHTART